MEFKMKEATNKREAIISLLDVQSNKPELLPNNTVLNESGLDSLPFKVIRDLFIKVKNNYYDSIDWNKRF
tara:strand:+ start:610 stop:819 length:210 start_codon:yes stop_codon:yes gene_type:complete